MATMLYQDRIIPIEWIYCPRVLAPWSQRTEPLEDLHLQRSLELVGQLNNILVVPTGETRYALIAGRRRYEAAKALGWEFLSVKVISGQFSTHRLFSMFLAENIHRLHLTPDAARRGAETEATLLEWLDLEDRRESQPYLWPRLFRQVPAKGEEDQLEEED